MYRIIAEYRNSSGKGRRYAPTAYVDSSRSPKLYKQVARLNSKAVPGLDFFIERPKVSPRWSEGLV